MQIVWSFLQRLSPNAAEDGGEGQLEVFDTTGTSTTGPVSMLSVDVSGWPWPGAYLYSTLGVSGCGRLLPLRIPLKASSRCYGADATNALVAGA